jgi:hypothetical protein
MTAEVAPTVAQRGQSDDADRLGGIAEETTRLIATFLFMSLWVPPRWLDISGARRFCCWLQLALSYRGVETAVRG